MAVNCDLFGVDLTSGSARHVRVIGEDDEPTTLLIDQLRRALPGSGPLYLDGRRLSESGTIGELGLVDGTTVTVGAPLPPIAPVQLGRLEARIVGGPDAGMSFPLPLGTAVIGRSPSATVHLTDQEASREHAALVVSGDGAVTIRDLGSMNGTFIEGRPIRGVVDVSPGDWIQIGSTLIAVDRTDAEALHLVTEPGHFGLHRRFRAAPPTWPGRVSFPREPEPRDRPPLNLLLTLAPAVLVTVIAVVTKRWELVIFAAATPLIGLGRAVIQRRNWRRRRAAEAQSYTSQRDGADRALFQALRAERLGRRATMPDLAELAVHARLPGRRLWERQTSDDDLLDVRVGVAEQPSTVVVDGEDQPGPLPVWRVPVGIRFAAVRNLSVIGSRDRTRRVAAGLVLQLAAQVAPRDVKIVVIADEAAADAWSWVTWLPHCRWAPDEVFRLVGSDQLSVRARLSELRDLIKRRRAKLTERRGESFHPAVVVVLDDTSRLLNEGFGDVLRDGPGVAIHAICLDPSHVPESCLAALTLGDTSFDDAHLDKQGSQPIDQIVVDAPSARFCGAVARALSPLRALGEEAQGGELPSSLRLLDLLELSPLRPDLVVERWRASSGSASAVVGLTHDGVFELDLTHQGPHGLVAGTTRSGKSEFLKTLVAAFALTFAPEELAFLFIDFKGGADYRIACQLPHAVDLSTSEDLEDFERTLRLLEAEIGRRRTLFERATATTIEGYRTARQTRGDLPAMGRLVVVADEFAELVSKAPLQLDKLVSVARTGAAFGVHLLLATQRPAGAVTGQIDANVALRVCFRVAKREESIEVIGEADAADVAERHRGRGFFRAHGEPLEEFQSARVAGARPGSRSDRVPLRAFVVLWSEIGRVPAQSAPVEVPDPDTDFWDVLGAVAAAAGRTGQRTHAVPWPRPLPETVTFDEIPEPPDPALMPFALADDPASQAHRALGLRLGGGSVAIGGSAGTGRTTALRGLACTLARRASAADVHLYLIDFGGGSLRPLIDLPHCGGAALDEDWEQAGRIVRELELEVGRRLELFSERAISSLLEERRVDAAPLPHLVLFVDGWEVLNDEGGRYGLSDRIAQLVARGQAAGLQVAVAGDRTVALGRLGRLIGERFALRFNRDTDYNDMGLSTRSLPSVQPNGRAVALPGAITCQFALLPDPEQIGQAGAIRRVVEEVRQREASTVEHWPRRIEPLPRKIALTELVRRGEPSGEMATPAIFGLSADSGRPVYADLSEPPYAMFVAGPSGSGRTTALLAIAEILLGRGRPLVAVTPRRSELARLGARRGVTMVEGPAARQLDVERFSGDSVVMLIDDAESLDGQYDAHVSLASGRSGIPVVVASGLDALANASTGWLSVLKRSRTGLILSPRSKFDGAIIGSTLPDHLVFTGPPGRAVASVGGRLDLVQVPTVQPD